MRANNVLFLMIQLLAIGPSFANGVSVKIKLERGSISQEESLSLDVVVEGTQGATSPVLKNTSAFEVSSAGRSTQIHMINGVTTSSIVYSFNLFPRRKGQFKIGPAQVSYKGKVYRSNQVSVNVSDSKKVDREKLFFVESKVNKNKVYVNEQLVYTFRFFRRAQLANAKLAQPQFQEFWKESLGEQREYQTTLNGINWSVTEISVALFPNRAGKIIISEAVLSADFIVRQRNQRGRRSLFDSFFDSPFSSAQTKRVRLKTKKITLQVLDLPSQGKDESFSGLVGDLEMETDLSKRSLNVGESTTLTVRLKGSANLRDADLGAQKWEQGKVYDDEPVLKLNPMATKLLGTKEFKRALVPSKEGKLAFGPFKIQYFDPSTKQYIWLSSPLIEMDVAASVAEDFVAVGGGEKRPGNKKKIKVLGRDIMPISRSAKALQSDVLSIREKWVAIIFIILLPCVYYLGLFLWVKRRRLKADVKYVNRSMAYKRFKSKVKTLPLSSKLYEEASITFRSYLKDKLGVDALAMTSSDVASALEERGPSGKTIEEVSALINQCEMGQFGGQTLDENQAKNLVAKLKELASILEKEIRA